MNWNWIFFISVAHCLQDLNNNKCTNIRGYFRVSDQEWMTLVFIPIADNSQMFAAGFWPVEKGL